MTLTPTQARLQAACKYLVLAVVVFTVVGVLAVAGAQDGVAAPAPGVTLRPDDITNLGGLGVTGLVGWQAVMLAQRFVDTFGRAVTAVERIVSEGVRVDDVRTHASAVVDLADAVRGSAHRTPPAN